MPVRLTTFNKSGNDGSMMGPVMLTAATCCQNEKVKSASIDQNKVPGKDKDMILFYSLVYWFKWIMQNSAWFF